MANILLCPMGLNLVIKRQEKRQSYIPLLRTLRLQLFTTSGDYTLPPYGTGYTPVEISTHFNEKKKEGKEILEKASKKNTSGF